MRKIVKRLIAITLAMALACSLMTNLGISSVKAAADYTADVQVTYDQASAREMLQYINAFRTSTPDQNDPATAWYTNQDGTKKDVTGLNTLQYDYTLEAYAMQRAAEIAVSFSHTRPNGSSTQYAENIAAGTGSMTNTAMKAFVQWREDNLGYAGEGHRRNMLGQSHTRVGIGHVVYNGIHFWVQNFGGGSATGEEVSPASGSKTVPIEISNNQIDSLYSNTTLISLNSNSSVNLPSVAFTLKESWYTTIPCTPTFSLADEEYLSISDGKLVAKSIPAEAVPYSTTLTASAYGKTLDFTVNVRSAYTITYNLDGGTLPSGAVSSYSDGETVILPTPTKTGYKFSGWYNNSSYTGSAVTRITSNETGSKVYHAKWAPNSYTLLYNSNGGTGSMASSTGTYDQNMTLSKNSFKKEGYTFDSWNTKADGSGTRYLDQASVKNLSSEDNGRVTLYAIWKESDSPFVDVLEGAFYYDAVKWAAEKKITTGKGDRFDPTGTCTRKEVVTFLWRAAGEPKPNQEYMNRFSDVPEGKYFTDAVAWAVEKEITTGKGNRFDPDGLCTRQEIVTFLWRAADKPNPSQEYMNKFSDVPEGKYFTDAVAWAVENEITQGMGNNTFRPTRTCDRGQVVTFLYRNK